MEIWRNSVVRLLLLGTRDEASALRLLRGHDVVLKMILDHLIAIWKDALVFHVRGFVQFGAVEYDDDWDYQHAAPEFQPQFVRFPAPLMEMVEGRMQCKPFHVNMMPFVIGNLTSLPQECRRYDRILEHCFSHCGERGAIGYLTIHEGMVEAHTSQRRPGLHVEAPNAKKMKKRFRRNGFSKHEWAELKWGEGWYMDHQLTGGIYMASNIADSCGIWNCVVKGKSDIVGDLGDVDVLHGILKHNQHEYYKPQANELIWITDHTPHESLPLSTTQFRQYFRFVTSNVSVWFADHSTPNPLGIQPAATIVYGKIMDPSLQRTFRGHKSGISSLSYGPRLQLVSGAMDCTVMVWNVKPSARAFRFLGHKGPVFDVKWAPSADLIASGSQDRTVRLWTPSVKGESHVIKGHVGGVRSVDFSYDSTELLTASDDKSIKMWSLPTRRFVCSWNGHSNWVRSARFSPDARLLVSGSDDKTVKLWDKATRNCISTFYDHSGIINAVRFHPDGTTIGACSFDNTINLWDVRSQKLIQHYPAHEANVTSLDFHPNGHYCLSTSVDGTIKLWDIREGHLLYTMHGHTGSVNCATFSMDGKLTASGAVDALVMVWETDLDKCLHANDTNYPAALPKAQVLKHVPAPEPTPVAPVTHMSAVIPGVTKAPPREHAFQNISLPHPSMPPPNVPPPSVPQTIPLQNDKHDLYNPAAIRYDPVPNNNYQEDVRSSISEKKDLEQRLPDNLSSTFDHIVGQLEIITRTLSILEERLCHAEDRIADVARVQTQMLRQGSYRSAQPVVPSNATPSADKQV